MKSRQCPKIKNPCKYCLQAVNNKNGLQCQGACKKWAHFKCLNFTPGKISDIKAGIIKVMCPCPDCETTVPKEFLTNPPFTCSNQRCPANKLPICDSAECPSKPMPKITHSCPPKSCRQPPSCTPLPTPSPCSKQLSPPETCPRQTCSSDPSPKQSSPSEPCQPRPCLPQPCPLEPNPLEFDLTPCPVPECPLQKCPLQQCPLQQCPLQQCPLQPCSLSPYPPQHCPKLPCPPHPCPARPCPQPCSPLPCTHPKCTKPHFNECENPSPLYLPTCPVSSQPHDPQNSLVDSNNEVTAFSTSMKSPSSSILSTDDSEKYIHGTSSSDSNLVIEESSMAGTLEDMNNTLDKLTTQMKYLIAKVAKN